MNSENKLLISSDFYSIQGEGISSGVPSYFIRLANCNLHCGLSRRHMNEIIKGGPSNIEDGEVITGDLHMSGEATWTCDSVSQWAVRGENKDFQYLIDRWKEQGIYDDILNGTIHLIWTGGEPTIPHHQEEIVNFINYWRLWELEDSKNELVDLDYIPFHEIETNGTFYIGDELFSWLSQINCSPKLSNSGMTEKQRIVPLAIKRIMEHDNYQFKFVISTEEDVKEIFRDFVEPFNIPLHNVVCMPGLDDVNDFEERTRFVMEMAKKYRFRGLTRLHIAAWNKTLNV
jgi:organic radical activating enzyme